MEIEHNSAKHTFEIRDEEGTLAGHADYRPLGQDSVDFDHTVIDPAFRGQGLSTPLIQAALDEARAQGWQVKASCSAVAHFIDKNPEYRELLG